MHEEKATHPIALLLLGDTPEIKACAATDSGWMTVITYIAHTKAQEKLSVCYQNNKITN